MNNHSERVKQFNEVDYTLLSPLAKTSPSSLSLTPPPVPRRQRVELPKDSLPLSFPPSELPPEVNKEFLKFTSFGNSGGTVNTNTTSQPLDDKAILEIGFKTFLNEAEFLECKKEGKFPFFRKNSSTKTRSVIPTLSSSPEMKFKATKRKEFLKTLKAFDGPLSDLALEKKYIDWLIKTLRKKGQEEDILVAAQWLSIHSYPVERVPGLRKKILSSGGIKEIFKLAKERKVYVHTPIDPKEIILEKQIGKGSGGKIFSAKWQGKIIAVKMCSESNIFYSSSEEFHFELAITSILDHPNILPCLGGNTNVSECFLAMPLCKMGSLEEILRPMDETKKMTVDWSAKITIASKVSAAMSYIHSLGILHRDLKTSNVLIGNDFDDVYLIDFGISRVLSNRMTINVGTTAMIAPELLEGNGKYSEKADVYSFGIMLWEIVAERRPYEEIGSWEIPGKVIEGYRPAIPADCLDLLEDIIISCWDQNPSKRPSFLDITEMFDKHKTSPLI